MTSNLVTMATQKGAKPFRGVIEKPQNERDTAIAEAGEAGGTVGTVGTMLGQTTRMSFMAASEQWECNKNGKRLRCETSELASALGDWRSELERHMRQQAQKVTQLHQTIDRMARMPESRVACDDEQWLSMKEWLADRGMNLDERHKDNVLCRTGIVDIPTKVLAKAGVGETSPAQEVIKEESNQTVWQQGGGLKA